MKINIRTNHGLRMKAFDLLQGLKRNNISRKIAIDEINVGFGIPVGTLYDWYRNKCNPYGRRGEIIYNSELFYVIGALLGDGCLYNWKTTNYYLILVGDREFTSKYAEMLTRCTYKRTKAYINRSKNIWFVRSNNFKLYSLFKKVREDLSYLEQSIKQNDSRSALLFIEGFFDAEGCVKIIRERIRKIPKICLDITNTNFEILELVRKLLQEKLHIEARYSIQRPDPTKNKKTAYHLRIYRKEYVRGFFENIDTVKLKPRKISYLRNWLRD